MPWWFSRPSPTETRRRAVHGYVQAAALEPAPGDVEWLAGVATAGDTDRARWELRYARRALALLVAERDALDDRTASDVARELRAALQLDRSVAAGMVRVAERQLNERLAAYRTAMSVRSPGESAETRMARVLIGAGPRRELGEDLQRGVAIVRSYLAGAQDALRGAFGVVSLPEDRPPSDLPLRRSG